MSTKCQMWATCQKTVQILEDVFRSKKKSITTLNKNKSGCNRVVHLKNHIKLKCFLMLQCLQTKAI